MKTVFRIMPFIILPMTINFPTVGLPLTLIRCIFCLLPFLSENLLFLLSNAPQAVFTYWLTSNCFSLGQVALLRLPFVREKFRIPERIKHPASSLPQNDGFVQSMKKGEFLERSSTISFGIFIKFVMLILL